MRGIGPVTNHLPIEAVSVGQDLKPKLGAKMKRRQFVINHRGLIDGILVTLRTSEDKVPEIILRISKEDGSALNPETDLLTLGVEAPKVRYEVEAMKQLTEEQLQVYMEFLVNEYGDLCSKGLLYPTYPGMKELIEKSEKGISFEANPEIHSAVFETEISLNFVKKRNKANSSNTYVH